MQVLPLAYLWPHSQLIATEDGGRITLLRGIWSPSLAAVGVRFATPEGVGYGSSMQEIRAAFGERQIAAPLLG